jgi:hypothetical protein
MFIWDSIFAHRSDLKTFLNEIESKPGHSVEFVLPDADPRVVEIFYRKEE